LESAFGSGLLAGLAVATHLLAALTVPFLGLLAVALAWRRTRRVREGARVAVAWGLGVLPSLVCLAWFNEYRFGSFLDTGFRASAAEMLEQRFVAPLVGISGLLFSAGKGLAFYCPLAVVAAAFWPSFWRKHRLVAAFVLLLSAARLAFVGSFRDWHGGFCLGPRYLLGVVPFLLLPLAAGIEDLIASRRRGPAAVLWVAAGLCLCQQIVLGAGEIFSYLYGVKWRGLAAGLDVFRDDYLYFSWRVSPLLHLLEGQRGPWLLRRIAAGNTALAGLLCALGLVLLLWAWIRAFRTTQPLATGKKP
jgi:4-amino-4-deoxy-L-arabinose transferase-like glycosyltransferase